MMKTEAGVFIRLAVQSAFILLLAACVSSSVVKPGGSDHWSRAVGERWAPKSQAALDAFDRFAKAQLGETLKTRPQVFLAANADEAKALLIQNPNAVVSTLISTFGAATLNQRAQGDPVRAYMRAMQEQLSAGKHEGVPLWLRDGAANEIASRVMEELGTPVTVKAAYEGAGNSLRALTKGAVTANEIFVAQAAPKGKVGIQAMSVFMFTELQERMGENLWPAYARYMRAAASPDFDPIRAFEANFGLARKDFLVQVESRVEAVRAEKRQHALPVPEESGFARIDETERFPLNGDEEQKFFAAYRRAKSPKALAISPKGSRAYNQDDVNAIQKALDACKLMDELRCQLYAVDDRVVYQPAGGIEVRWASGNEGNWNKTVLEKWLPMTQSAVDQFNTMMVSRVGTSLNLKTRIYVTSTASDYERVLRDELKQLNSRASSMSEFSGGMSSGDGRIALIVRDRNMFEPEFLQSAAVKTPLHELVHELQAELARGNRSRGLKWISEGTADLFAFEVAQELKIDGASSLSKQNWMKKNQAWHKTGGWIVSPEDVWISDQSEWDRLMVGKKGPYQMAGLMAAHLQSLLGDRFFAAWVAYYKSLGDTKKAESVAFDESFGMNKETFLKSFRDSLN